MSNTTNPGKIREFDSLNDFYERGGAIPANTSGDENVKPFSRVEQMFLEELAAAVPFPFDDVAACYRFVKSFDDTARICQLCVEQGQDLKTLVSASIEATRTGSAMPEVSPVEIKIAITDNTLNLEFNRKEQYLAFSFRGAIDFANQILDAVKIAKQNRRSQYYK